MEIRRLLRDELAWANERYAEVDFQPSTERDFLALAELDGARAGIGRLVPIDAGTAELGGIYVVPAFRGRSVARALVQFLLDHSSHGRLICLPFARLSAFYESLGFTPPGSVYPLPEPIIAKLEWCRLNHKEPVQLLVRDSF